MLSSFVTILLYKSLLEENNNVKAFNVKEVGPAKSQYASYTSPFTKQSSYISAAPTSFTGAAEKSAPAVVHISSIYSNFGGRSMFEELWGGRESEASSGSGVIISPDGY